MRLCRAIVLVAATTLVIATDVIAGEALSLPHGISVEMPLGWRRADASEHERSEKSQNYRDPKLMQRLHEGRPEQTLLLLAKHPADHVGLNPIIMITRATIPNEIKGISADKVVEMILPFFTHGFYDVRIETWSPSIIVGGKKAASATTTYSIHPKSGRVVAARATVVIVIDGNHFIMIGVSSRADGEDDARKEFNKFIATVRFKRAA